VRTRCSNLVATVLAQHILEANRGALDAAAAELLAKETLSGDEMLDIIARHPAVIAPVAELEPVGAVRPQGWCTASGWVYVGWAGAWMIGCLLPDM